MLKKRMLSFCLMLAVVLVSCTPAWADTTYTYKEDGLYTTEKGKLLINEDFEDYEVSTAAASTLEKGGITQWTALTGGAVRIVSDDLAADAHGKVLSLERSGASAGEWDTTFDALTADANNKLALQNAEYVKVSMDIRITGSQGQESGYFFIKANAGEDGTDYLLNMFGNGGPLRGFIGGTWNNIFGAWYNGGNAGWVNLTYYFDLTTGNFATTPTGLLSRNDQNVTDYPYEKANDHRLPRASTNYGYAQAADNPMKALSTLVFSGMSSTEAHKSCAYIDNLKIYTYDEEYDPDAFVLTASDIENGASNAALISSLGLTYSQAVADAGVVTVTEAGSETDQYTVTVSGSTISINFARKLKANTAYTITLSGVTGENGKSCDTAISFRTESGVREKTLTGGASKNYTDDSIYQLLLSDDFEDYDIASSTDVFSVSDGTFDTWTSVDTSQLVNTLSVADSGSSNYGQVLRLNPISNHTNWTVHWTELQQNSLIKEKLDNASYIKFEYDAAMQNPVNTSAAYFTTYLRAGGKAYMMNMFGNAGGINQKNNGNNVASGSKWTQGTWVNMKNYIDMTNARYNTKVNSGNALSTIDLLNSSVKMTADTIETLAFQANAGTPSCDVYIDNVKVYIASSESCELVSTSIADGETDVATDAGFSAKYTSDLAGATVSVQEKGYYIENYTAEINGKNINITMPEGMIDGVEYIITLKNVKNAEGAAAPDTTVTFTTLSGGVFALESVSVTDGETGYAVTKDKPITIKYSSKLDEELFNSGLVELYEDGQLFTGYTVDMQDGTITITLTEDLKYGTQYTIKVGEMVALNGLTVDAMELSVTTMDDVLQLVNDAAEVSDIKTVLENNLTALTDTYADIDGAYFNTNTYTSLLDNAPYADLSEVADLICTAGEVYQQLTETGYYGLTELLSDHGDMILAGYESSYTKYEGLTEKQKNELNQQIVKKADFTTFRTFAEDFSSLCTQYIKSLSSSSSSASSGGSGGASYSLPTTTAASSANTGTASDTASTAEPDSTEEALFADLDQAEWARDDILSLYEAGIISADKYYRPIDSITREEYAKLLVLAAGLEVTNAESVFPDADPDAWYVPYINTAHKAGLVNGYEDGSFGVGRFITREEIAVMIYRAIIHAGLPMESGDAQVFTDREDISGYALEAVAAMQAQGLISGMGDGTFAPKANATRAQAARLIAGMIQYCTAGADN